jgi:hypothetical protein
VRVEEEHILFIGKKKKECTDLVFKKLLKKNKIDKQNKVI